MSLTSEAGSCTLRTFDDVSLEAETTVPLVPLAAVIIAHPHPLHGGNMHNALVSALFEALPGAGVAVLRFNFRGAGKSTGAHDEGRSERFDVIAAIDHLTELVPNVPVAAAGYSFGSIVALAVNDPRIAGWLAIAPPLTALGELLDPIAEVATDPRPKMIIHPAQDQYTALETAQKVTESWTNASIESIASADHFLAGRTGEVVFKSLMFFDRLTVKS